MKTLIRASIPSPLTIEPKFSDLKNSVNFRYINAKGIHEPQKLLEFAMWIGKPRENRFPRDQKDFAYLIGKSQDTLTNWKEVPGFWDEVSHYRNSYFRENTTEVLNGLMKRAKLGYASEVALFMQIFEGFDPNRPYKPTPIPWDEKLSPEQEIEFKKIFENRIQERYKGIDDDEYSYKGQFDN